MRVDISQSGAIGLMNHYQLIRIDGYGYDQVSMDIYANSNLDLPFTLHYEVNLLNHARVYWLNFE